MIIRATKQLLQLSRIPPEKFSEEVLSPFPGEWYANQVIRFDGKYKTIHFLHNPTRISILVPGTKLKSSITTLESRTNALLIRNGYGRLLFKYQMASPPAFYTTNNRSIIASMNQMRYGIEHHLSMPEVKEEIDLNKIEDIQLSYLFTTPKKGLNFLSANRILDEILLKEK